MQPIGTVNCDESFFLHGPSSQVFCHGKKGNYCCAFLKERGQHRETKVRQRPERHISRPQNKCQEFHGITRSSKSVMKLTVPQDQAIDPSKTFVSDFWPSEQRNCTSLCGNLQQSSKQILCPRENHTIVHENTDASVWLLQTLSQTLIFLLS